MSELHLVLAGFEFSISAPEDVVSSLRHFYPRSLSPAAGAFPTEIPARRQFRLACTADGWSLSSNDQPLGVFARPDYALLALEHQIETEVAAVDDGRIAIHAGAVETSKGAWLIAGNPDAGKTSSTFQLLQLEQSFLCEEIALYDPAQRAVHPYPQTPTLDRHYMDEFESRFPVQAGALHPVDETIVRFVPDRFSEGPVPLDLLLLPRFQPGKRAQVTELRPEEALTEMLGYCFPPGGGEEQLFDAMIDLLENTPLLRATYGDLGQARDLYRNLLSDDRASV